MAKLSTLAMYNADPTIFNGLNLPAGLDRGMAVQKICLDTAELEVLYPEPVTLQTAITLWSAVNYPLWQRMYNVLTAEYNPLWNVDATVETNTMKRGETQNTGALTTEETGTIEDDRTIDTTHTGTQGLEGEKRNTGTVGDAGSKTNTGTQTVESETTNTGTVGDSGSKTNTGTVGNTGSKTNTGTVGDSGSKINTGTQTHDITIDEDDTQSVAAYNSPTMQQTTASTHDGDNQDMRTDNLTETTSNTRTDNLTETTSDTRTDNLTETTTNTRTDNLTEDNETTRTDNLTETTANTRTDNLLEETESTRTDNLRDQTSDGNIRAFDKTTKVTDTRNFRDDRAEDHQERRTGNIGTTASQDLVMKELEVAKVSIYKTIVESYKKEFCICIY